MQRPYYLCPHCHQGQFPADAELDGEKTELSPGVRRMLALVKKETVGRQGKTEGQPAHAREVELGCVFTQTKGDKDGFPIRDPGSTTYTGAIETAEEFGKRIYLEACQRGTLSNMRNLQHKAKVYSWLPATLARTSQATPRIRRTIRMLRRLVALI
ncbi:MAG: hypothetical protein ACYDC6_02525 [Acidobacteriaceae bacterium]